MPFLYLEIDLFPDDLCNLIAEFSLLILIIGFVPLFQKSLQANPAPLKI